MLAGVPAKLKIRISLLRKQCNALWFSSKYSLRLCFHLLKSWSRLKRNFPQIRIHLLLWFEKFNVKGPMEWLKCSHLSQKIKHFYGFLHFSTLLHSAIVSIYYQGLRELSTNLRNSNHSSKEVLHCFLL